MLYNNNERTRGNRRIRTLQGAIPLNRGKKGICTTQHTRSNTIEYGNKGICTMHHTSCNTMRIIAVSAIEYHSSS